MTVINLEILMTENCYLHHYITYYSTATGSLSYYEAANVTIILNSLI